MRSLRSHPFTGWSNVTIPFLPLGIGFLLPSDIWRKMLGRSARLGDFSQRICRDPESYKTMRTLRQTCHAEIF